MDEEPLKVNQTVQRTGASRLLQRQIQRQRRLAPVADLYVRLPQKPIPMFDLFSTLAAGSELPMDATSELQERGFVVISGPVPSDRMELLVDAYGAAVASATGDDIKIGSTSTRVSDFVNRGAEFDELYMFLRC